MQRRRLWRVVWMSILILIIMSFAVMPHVFAAEPASTQPQSNIQSTPSQIFTAETYVRAVLLTTPDCRFCRQIVEQDLPPILDRFGQQLQILLVDISHPSGETLYQAALQYFEVGQPGVPLLIIDRIALQGSNIADRLPALVERYLMSGGVDWPAVPGLAGWLDDLPDFMSLVEAEAPCIDCDLTATRQAAMASTSVSMGLSATVNATDDAPVVKAVMFWMEGCPACHQVLDKVLPPLQRKYNQQFEILLIELITSQDVDALYSLAAEMGISQDRVGVPFLVIGEHVLIGSGDIPAELPGLIDQYLAAGGVDYPDSPALASFISKQTPVHDLCPPRTPCDETPQTATTPAAAKTQQPTYTPVSLVPPVNSPTRPSGYTLAIVVLFGMVVAVVYSSVAFIRQSIPNISNGTASWLDWATIVLALVGIGVAGYLAYVETQAVTAICGPVGDCNTVQKSSYARLFGVLPVGVLGMFGYLAILAAWIIKTIRRDRWANLAALAIFGMSFAGTLFSIYLTYLEPFVIRAVCMWCVSSAVIMTLLLLVNVPSALLAMHRLNQVEISIDLERESDADKETP